MVEMAKPRTAAAGLELAPIVEQERHPSVRHRLDSGGAAVDKPEAVFIPGPADAVPGAELDAFRPVDPGPAPAPADLGGFPGNRAALRSFEALGTGLVVDTDHSALGTLLDAERRV